MTTTEKKQNMRRKEIIKAIHPLLTGTPLSELSVKDICAAAGISVGTFYHYFKQKEDLAIVLWTKADEYLVESVFPNMTDEDEIENIRTYAMGITKFVEELGVERDEYVMANYKPVDRDFDENLRPEISKVTETILAGQKKGQITDEFSAEELQDYVKTAVQGVGIEWVRRGGNYSLTDKMERFLDVFLRCLKKKT